MQGICLWLDELADEWSAAVYMAKEEQSQAEQGFGAKTE